MVWSASLAIAVTLAERKGRGSMMYALWFCTSLAGKTEDGKGSPVEFLLVGRRRTRGVELLNACCEVL